MTAAALYVHPRGVYARLGCDVWGEERDARLYPGPLPVVAHPPCQRWGRLGTPRARGPGRVVTGAPVGADGGCFAAALTALITWGGVLEHPAGSRAWPAHGLPVPSGAGWEVDTLTGLWACEVWQSAYGHRAPKQTWIIYSGRTPPTPLDWRRVDPGGRVEKMCKAERERTPEPFARALVALALASGGAS
jgi:hypothetical protein